MTLSPKAETINPVGRLAARAAAMPPLEAQGKRSGGALAVGAVVPPRPRAPPTRRVVIPTLSYRNSNRDTGSRYRIISQMGNKIYS